MICSRDAHILNKANTPFLIYKTKSMIKLKKVAQEQPLVSIRYELNMLIDEYETTDDVYRKKLQVTSTLTTFIFSINDISSGPDWPTNAFSNPLISNVNLRRCGLSQTSVDRIIINIANIATLLTGTINLSNTGSGGALNSPRSTGVAVTNAITFLTTGGKNWNITTA